MRMKTLGLKLLFIGMAAFIAFLIFWLTVGLISVLQDQRIFIEKLIMNICLDLAAIVALFIIYNLYRLLAITDVNEMFSKQSLSYIRNIRRSTFIEFILLWGILPLTYHFADQGDAPGIMIVGLGVVSIPLIFGLFMAAIEKFFTRSLQLDSENKLTI